MPEIQRLLIVGLGGSVGAVLRYLISKFFIASDLTENFPFHTLLINLAGCFLAGLLSTVLLSVDDNQMTRLFLLTGFLGGFTTFSAFGIETVELLRSGTLFFAASYVLSSVLVGLMAVLAGISLAASFK